MILNLANDHMLGEIEWGVRDCCTGACDVFLSLFGVDPMAPLRGSYSTKFGAYRQINQRGGWSRMTEDLAVSSGLLSGVGGLGELGLTRQGVANYSGGRALAICAGEIGWIIKAEMGYVLRGFNAIERSWRWVS